MRSASGFTSMTELMPGPCLSMGSMRARTCSTSLCEVVAPLAMSACSFATASPSQPSAALVIAGPAASASNRQANRSSLFSFFISVPVEVEAVAVQVLDGELRETPGLLRQGFGDVGTGVVQRLVHGLDVGRVHPVHRGLERAAAAAQENRRLVAVDGADSGARLQPAHLEAELVPVMRLRALDVAHRQLGRRAVEGEGA